MTIWVVSDHTLIPPLCLSKYWLASRNEDLWSAPTLDVAVYTGRPAHCVP